jgi:coenzyme F420-reducing hydrogenase beta subunit
VGPSNLAQVIESGMCIGCGACVAADSSIQLELDPTTQGYRPSHPGDEKAAAVCPALAVDFDLLHDRVFPGREVGEHGVIESVHLAQSTDEGRNTRASSGGLIKELLLRALADPEVTGVISIVHRGGVDFGAQLVTDPDDVDSLPGSIYHALPFDDALRILAEHEGRYVLVAIPCQLEGIYTYVHTQAPHLADRIHSTIGLLCGWQYTHHALRAICDYKGVDYDDITDISFRGDGPVGKLHIATSTSAVEVSRRVDFSYQVAFDRSFNVPRCHLCVNHSNFLADIVVGDAWLPSTVFTRTGISLVICRTRAARMSLDALADAGRVVSVEVGTPEIEESQTRRVVFGDFAYAYQDYLRETGQPHPEMTGPNRRASRPVPRDEVVEFHAELGVKRGMQARREYRQLWRRKLRREMPRLSKRYLDWFLVRVLRVKSLTGERKEVSLGDMRRFR